MICDSIQLSNFACEKWEKVSRSDWTSKPWRDISQKLTFLRISPVGPVKKWIANARKTAQVWSSRLEERTETRLDLVDWQVCRKIAKSQNSCSKSHIFDLTFLQKLQPFTCQRRISVLFRFRFSLKWSLKANPAFFWVFTEIIFFLGNGSFLIILVQSFWRFFLSRISCIWIFRFLELIAYWALLCHFLFR